MVTHSIRWRLQLWLGFLLICILSGFGFTAYHLHRTNQLTQIDQELQRRVDVLSSALRTQFIGEGRGPRPPPPPGGPPRRPLWDEPPDRRPQPRGPGPDRPFPSRPAGALILPPTVQNLFDPAATHAFYFVLWSPNGVVLNRSTNAPADIPLPAVLGPGGTTHMRRRDQFREGFYFNSLGECILAGRDVAADFDGLRRFAILLLVAGSTVLVLGLGGGWWLTTRAIRPIEEISTAASRISAGNLSERISVAEADNELSRLAGVLNDTFARLEAAFAQQKQFTADASHELRTPIAVLISEAQTALARQRSNAEYRETIEANLSAAQQMRQLTESLLALAVLDAGHEPLRRRPFDLAQVARGCVDLLRPLATERRLEVCCELPPTDCLGDPERLSQVITNLLTNAIHHTPDGGRIRVTARTENGAALLTVADTGSGIAPEDLPHVFERFYRADRSRSRAEGRSGLGLAISKAIVDAHGGSIQATSDSGGSTFTVRLPPPP